MQHEGFFFSGPYFFETEADLKKAIEIERNSGGDFEEFENGLASEGITYSHTAEGLPEAKAQAEAERNATERAQALHTPRTIYSADDVRAAFPGGEIDHNRLSFDFYPCVIADEKNVSIDGLLEWKHIEALAYWRAHRHQFHPDAASSKT